MRWWTVVLAATLACSRGAQEAQVTAGRDAIEAGRVLYLANGCAVCHGQSGGGDGRLAPTLHPPPRDFRRPDAFRSPRTVVDLATVIAAGIPSGASGMPSYAHLDEASRRQLARYILSLSETAGGGSDNR